jgi:hypothetical protein
VDSDSDRFLLASAGAPVVAPGVRSRVPSFADPSPSFCVLREGEFFPRALFLPSFFLFTLRTRELSTVHSLALKASSASGRGSGVLGACLLVLLFVSPRARAQRRSHEEQTVARAILNVWMLAPRTVERVHDADVSTRAIRVCVHLGGSGRSLQGAD